jgi:hypothetical protein
LEWGVYGGGDGNEEISLRATWDQGGQDPITARRVPSKYREMKGGKKNKKREKQKARGLLHNCIARSIIMNIVNACN